MLYTQRQQTFDLGPLLAAVVLAIVVAAATVIALYPASQGHDGAAGSIAGASDVPVWVTIRDEEFAPSGATSPASGVLPGSSSAGSRWQSSVYEQNAGASDQTQPVAPVGNSGGGGHRGGLIPQ